MKQVFVVHGISDCPACLRACADLMSEYPKYEYVFVNCDFSSLHRKRLKEIYGQKTFPIIVCVTPDGEELIGGHKELKERLSGVAHHSEYPAPPIRDKV